MPLNRLSEGHADLVHAPLLSVIIPVGGHSAAQERAFKSLGHLQAAPAELIFVWDGCAALPLPAELPIPQRDIRLASQRGPARARNVGAQQARGKWLCFVDADVSLPSGFLWQTLSLPERYREYQAFIGSYDDRPGHPGGISQYRNLLHHYVHQHGAEEAATFWGACGLINRGVFLAQGGFHPAFRQPSVEDIELGYRLGAAGHRIRLVKDWQVRHEKRWTLVSMVRTDLCQRALPWLRLLRQYGQWQRQDLNLDSRARWSGVGASLGLLGLLLSWSWPWFGGMGVCLLGGVGWLNRDFYRLLGQAHSPRLALQGWLLHLLYYVYSSVAVVWDVMSQLVGPTPAPLPVLSPLPSSYNE